MIKVLGTWRAVVERRRSARKKLKDLLTSKNKANTASAFLRWVRTSHSIAAAEARAVAAREHSVLREMNSASQAELSSQSAKASSLSDQVMELSGTLSQLGKVRDGLQKELARTTKDRD